MNIFDSFCAQKGLVAAAVVLAALSGTAQAAQITATTSGVDSGLDSILDELLPNVSPIVLGADNFFTISFDQGRADEFVESILFDLSADADAVFDNQDFFSFSSAPEVGSSSGITAADIRFSPVTRADFNNPSPTRRLEISFAPGSFGLGDFFSFGVDTNGVGDDIVAEFASLSSLTNDAIETFNDTGSDFGNSLATFSVVLEGGNATTVRFEDIGNYTSVAQAIVETEIDSLNDSTGLESSAESTDLAVAIVPVALEADRSGGVQPQRVAQTPNVELSEFLLVSDPTPERTAVPEPTAVLSLLLLGGVMAHRHRSTRSS